MTQIKQVSKDQYLVREGDTPSALFIIKSGQFAVTQNKEKFELRFSDINSGDVFGEIGLFNALQPYNVNLKALQNSEVIIMPYEVLSKQIEALPAWVQVIHKNLVNHLQKSFQYIQGNISNAHATVSADLHMGLQLTKFLSILNLVSLRNNGSFSQGDVRKFTIQVFQEATSRMNTLVNALIELGYLSRTQQEDQDVKYKSLKPEFLSKFVDWYNDWLFKPERSRMLLLKENDVETLKALLAFAKDLPMNSRGFTKINLHLLQTESEAKVGRPIRKEDIDSLVGKRYFSDPTMEETGVHILIPCDELEVLAENCALVNSLSKLFS